MKKIKLLLTIALLFCVSACSLQESYTRDTSAGAIVKISYEELREMYDNEETFVALLSQTSCSSCNEYKDDVLYPYIENHNVTIYEVNITDESLPSATWEQIISDYDSFEGTPHTMFVENGEDSDYFVGVMDEGDFDELVVTYELDKLVE